VTYANDVERKKVERGDGEAVVNLGPFPRQQVEMHLSWQRIKEPPALFLAALGTVLFDLFVPFLDKRSHDIADVAVSPQFNTPCGTVRF
jgi:hypothetical protein